MASSTSSPPRPPIGDLLDILPDAVLMIDAQGRIVYANASVQALLGYAPEELRGQDLQLLVPPHSRGRHAGFVWRYLREGTPTRMGSRPALQALHRDGDLVPVSISLCHWSLDDGQRVAVAVMHNLAELHTHLDRATELAETDPLSGLGNRLRLSRWMRAPLAASRPFSLLYMDLSRFKSLNDAHGHAAGDFAIKVVAQRLQSHVRESDLVVRLGGDEFVLLFDALNNASLLAQRAHAMAQTVQQPFRLGHQAWSLGANIGGAISPRHGSTEEALLHAADQAMYRAKQARETYQLAPA